MILETRGVRYPGWCQVALSPETSGNTSGVGGTLERMKIEIPVEVTEAGEDAVKRWTQVFRAGHLAMRGLGSIDLKELWPAAYEAGGDAAYTQWQAMKKLRGGKG